MSRICCSDTFPSNLSCNVSSRHKCIAALLIRLSNFQRSMYRHTLKRLLSGSRALGCIDRQISILCPTGYWTYHEAKSRFRAVCATVAVGQCPEFRKAVKDGVRLRFLADYRTLTVDRARQIVRRLMTEIGCLRANSLGPDSACLRPCPFIQR